MAGEIYIGSDNLVTVTLLKDVESGLYIDDAIVKMTLCKQAALNPDRSRLAYTGGGTYQVVAGNTIVGANSGAIAKVEAVTLESGTWAGSDAAGYFELTGQEGIFAAENLNVGSNNDVATITGDSSGSETANAGTKTKIPVADHGLDAGDFVRIEGTPQSDGIFDLDSVEDGKIIIPDPFVSKDYFTGDEDIFVGVPNCQEVSLTHEGGDADGYYDGVIPDTVELVNLDWYYLFIVIEKSPAILVQRLELKAVYLPITG